MEINNKTIMGRMEEAPSERQSAQKSNKIKFLRQV